jgi:hypothetical protein
MESLEKAKKTPRLIPKKMLVTRDGKVYQTTVWVLPEEAQHEKPSVVQPDIFETSELEEKINSDKPKLVVEVKKDTQGEEGGIDSNQATTAKPSSQNSEEDRKLLAEGITYQVSAPGNPLDGKTLKGGVPDYYGGVKVVRFKPEKVNGAMVVPTLKIDSRPDLQALVKRYEMATLENNLKQAIERGGKRGEEAAQEKLLLDKMRAEADKLRKQIPRGNVPVTVTQTGDMDGDPIYKYEADGVELSWRDVTIHGRAQATRPGAMAPFASEIIASIPKDKLEDIKVKKREAEREAQAKQDARRKELLETKIPEYAIRVYNYYHGNENAAWEDENEEAWAAIRKWRPYIEAQRGMHPDRMRAILNHERFSD